ncbi:xanthine dehydrogenase family protein subunit M [Sulfolobus sp. A20-N-F6]|uniref:glyceraldehyde dehydrogenase subunit beta n=1 Tax=Saccharolobus sp. A20 TaxID=1891280 RepID=UPI000845ECC4|nr:glyceraldehyde dehydrogenase subunit beta [Sulfolobus sp. A20]TRM78134.1 xanthine dehydrogenase family protein subunit M [Sulfolobus sp. B5]TRM78765.1 xanthine dehydrogenase family protein subunit M [Sulfolobus sp. A20-N-F8]TRM82020.1 xanthine dehydrogenase family protein subunit M [Sulfolobus sp. D5]TRM83521.1 xanthine dehydrogenase family protein subunit M [Sulfolobus sp. A20-N-F6]TRM88119.1 xanthine dehydrogenase family protein subunit M [Sulfolobus sp. C3]TRM92627.1 xanthine dehydrogen
MYPPDFTYVRVNSVDEATKFLDSQDDARPLAGGQSLIPMLKLRVISPNYIVDLNPIKDLSYVRSGFNSTKIGALTRYYEVLKNDTIKINVPLLYQAVRLVGDMQVRNLGTIGGSVGNADPSSDVPTVLTALDAEIVLTSSSGSRSVKALDFFKGAFTTDVKKGELITEIVLPNLEGYYTTYKKVVRRAGDYALVSLALAIKMKGRDIEDIRLAYAGVSDKPFRPIEVEKGAIGKSLDDSLIEDIVSKVSSQVNPPSDTRGSSWYRKEVMKVITRKALKEVMG